MTISSLARRIGGALWLASCAVHAGLPSRSNVTGSDTGDGASMLKYLIKTYGDIGLIGVGLFITAGVGWFSWVAFKNSIKQQEWGGFITTAFSGLALIGAYVGLALFGHSLIVDLV